MPYKNTLFPLESNTNTNSQLGNIIGLAKLFSNASWQFATCLFLAIAMQGLGFNSANASNLNSSDVQQLSGQVKDSNSSQKQDSSFLPRIFNLIANATKSQSVNDQLKPATPQSASAPKLAPFRPIAQSQKLYLADTKSVTKPAPLIHQVKQGETITAIASEYQVSSHDLVEINRLDNSNVIFVNQRLTIPASNDNKALNTPAPAIANLATVESPGVTNVAAEIKPTSLLQSSTEDPYIAKLRIEIEQRRAQYRQEQASKLNVDEPNVPNLISATETPQDELESQPQVQIPRAKAKLDSSVVKRNPKPDSNIQDSLALVLPPLSDSEEYLPSAFDGYAWPAQGVLTSGYGWRWGRLHRGIDIAAPVGTPIVAAAAGEVVGAGWHGGYGNLIKLEHLDGSVTYYAHNNRILVTHGQKVRQGEQIAEMGSTGRSTGSHLHFEIHLRNQEVADPLALLGSR